MQDTIAKLSPYLLTDKCMMSEQPSNSWQTLLNCKYSDAIKSKIKQTYQVKFHSLI